MLLTVESGLAIVVKTLIPHLCNFLLFREHVNILFISEDLLLTHKTQPQLVLLLVIDWESLWVDLEVILIELGTEEGSHDKKLKLVLNGLKRLSILHHGLNDGLSVSLTIVKTFDD